MHMDERDYFFETKSNNRLISRIIDKKYKSDSVIIKKAYKFALALLMQPVILDESIKLATNKLHITMLDPMCAEQLNREIQYMNEEYPGREQLFNDISIAKEIGIIQRWSGGHTSASIDLLFKEGFQNRINIAYKLLQNEKDNKRKNFLRAELIALLAAQKQIIRYSDEALKLYQKSQDEYDKKQYLKMADACKNIAYNPPADFFEAIQLIAVTHDFCSVEGNGATSQGMRIDQSLNPFYVADIEAGRITREEVFDTVCSLWRIFESYGERCANLTIGGCDQYGND